MLISKMAPINCVPFRKVFHKPISIRRHFHPRNAYPKKGREMPLLIDWKLLAYFNEQAMIFRITSDWIKAGFGSTSL